MLKTQLIHPGILDALGSMEHGSKVLIADGNYPFSTNTSPSAAHVYFNVRPGLVAVTDALKAVISATPVEAAHAMQPAIAVHPTSLPISARFWLGRNFSVSNVSQSMISLVHQMLGL